MTSSTSKRYLQQILQYIFSLGCVIISTNPYENVLVVRKKTSHLKGPSKLDLSLCLHLQKHVDVDSSSFAVFKWKEASSVKDVL